MDNLKCFSEFFHDYPSDCLVEVGSYANERVQNFAEALSKEGIVTLPDNENDTTIHKCM